MNIKFRVWCINKNEWERDLILLTPNGAICQLKNDVYIACSPETHIVEFYTGNEDKNGKKIYDGDTDGDKTVFWHKEQLQWKIECKNQLGIYDYPLANEQNFIVTGNIHESKQLSFEVNQ